MCKWFFPFQKPTLTVCTEVVANEITVSASNESGVIRGGFGEVTFQTRYGMRVAVKKSNDGGTVRQEADILSHLKHPFIPTLLSFTDVELVMADLGRQSLTEVLQAGRMWRMDYDKIAWCVASALAYMHACRFHHSDVKSDNVVVDSYGDAVLIDFNLSRHSPTGVSSTQCGSISYVAPEILTGRSTWNAYMADVWSFSVLYFAILYGHLPFDSSYKVFNQFLMLHPTHGSAASLRMVWSTSGIFNREDVKKIHEFVFDAMMQPIPPKRPTMASVEKFLYYIKHGLEDPSVMQSTV
tara:strand:- start:4887 stop:5774 length:888 start_codon:yes stop_codon:yes gene_type:complete